MSSKFISRITSIPTFRSLRHSNYRLFFIGQIFSLVGSWMQIMAQQWLVYQLTHSSMWLGIIGFLQNIPILFFSMYAGSLADRTSKHRLIILTQILSLVQAVILAVLILFNAATVEAVAVIAFLLGIINAFDIPVRQSFIIEMVGKEDLTNAIGLNSAAFNMARIVGPAIGGAVIAAFGLEWCFLFNGISFLAVIIGLLKMKIIEIPKPKREANIFKDLKESAEYLRSEKSLVALLSLVIVLTLFGWSYSVLLPIFAEEELKIGALGLGNLLTSVGIGAFISAVAVATFEGKVRPKTFIYFGLSTFVIFVTIFALSTNVALSSFCLIGVGMGLVSFFATANASLQRRSPDNLRGRVMGLYSVIFQGSFPFGSFMMGYSAKIFGVRKAILLGACICAISGFIVYFKMKSIRKAELKLS